MFKCWKKTPCHQKLVLWVETCISSRLKYCFRTPLRRRWMGIEVSGGVSSSLGEGKGELACCGKPWLHHVCLHPRAAVGWVGEYSDTFAQLTSVLWALGLFALKTNHALGAENLVAWVQKWLFTTPASANEKCFLHRDGDTLTSCRMLQVTWSPVCYAYEKDKIFRNVIIQTIKLTIANKCSLGEQRLKLCVSYVTLEHKTSHK